jgi:hypothetical protein
MSDFLTYTYRDDADPEGQLVVFICCQDSCNGFYHEVPAVMNEDGSVNEELSKQSMNTYLIEENMHPDYPDNYITNDEDL